MAARAQTPARDAKAASPATGSGSVSGRVTTDGGRAPLRGAIVTLRGDTLPLGRSAITDESGAFAIDALPAGHLTLSARKPAYVTMNYGAKHPEQAGTTIALGAGQRLDNLQIALPRGAVLSGTILDAAGLPMPGVLVYAARRDPLKPDTPLVPIVPGAQTDDRGAYRIFGLLPGEYAIAASTGRISMGAAATRGDETIDAIFRALEARAGGSTAARAPLASPERPPAEHAPPTSSMSYATIYYPGTSFAADAQLLRVKAGEERSGVDFSLVPTPTATIDGIVAMFAGVPAPTVALTQQGMLVRTNVQTLSAFPRLSPPDASGHFQYSGVQPGRYTITAVWFGASTQFASADVNVNGRNIAGLQLSPQPALKLSGRIVLDTEAPQTIDFTQARLRLSTPSDSAGLVMNGMIIGNPPSRPPSVEADGSFGFASVLPGSYQMSATTLGKTQLQMISAVVNGRDLVDSPLEIRGDLAGMVVTFSDKHSEISGRLVDAGGNAVTEDVVVAMPVDRALWSSVRRVVSTQPGTDGGFVIKDLPAGEYLLVAVTDLDPAELHDPELLGQLAGAGVKVTIGVGAKVRQDLRVK